MMRDFMMLSRLLPRAVTMAMARMSRGSAMNMSTMRMITSSTIPPK